MPVVLNSLKINAAVAALVKERKPHSFDGFIDSTGKFIAVATTIGVNYNPANTKITAENLILKKAELTTLVNASKSSVDTEKQNIIDFNVAYSIMPALTSDSLNAFKASENILPAQVKIASSNAKKVRGERIIPIKKVAVVEIETETIVDSGDKALNALRRKSVSFQKFGVRLGNFFTHINYIGSVVNYNTNEERLKSEALLAYYESLKVLSATLKASQAATNATRDARNEGFFNNVTGGRILFSQAKKAIASQKGGLKSATYKSIKGLPFPNLIKKSDRTATTDY